MWWVWLVFCDCGFHSVCPLMYKDKRLMEAFWWERLIVGVLFWRAMSCSVNLQSNILLMGVGGVLCSSLLFVLRLNYGRVNVSNGDLLQMDLSMHCCIQCPWPHRRPQLTHTSTGDSWSLTHRQVWLNLLWGHCSFLPGPGAHKIFFVPSKSLFPSPV